MAVGVGIWSLATAAGGMARNFGQMLVARSAVGVGEASYAAISPALISDYYPPERRGRVFAIFYLAIPVGSAVGYLLGGLLESHLRLARGFLRSGAAGPPAGAAHADRAGSAARHQRPAAGACGACRLLLGHVLALGRNRHYVIAVVGYALYTFAVGGMSFWVPMYLHRERGLSLSAADYLIGVVTVLAGIGGTFLGGYLADKLAPRFRQAYLYVSGFSMLAAIPARGSPSPRCRRLAFIAALFGAEFLVFLSTGPINVVLVSVVPVSIRATAMAVSIFVIHLFGDAAAPWLLGALSDRVGLGTAVLVVPIAIALSGVVWTYGAWSGVRHETEN